jgi:coenzyme F420-dependent glucose-6-phosphate dehydrogenase
MYEHAEETISDEEYKQKAVLSSDPAEHVERLSALKDLGATSIAVMNCSGADPEGAVKVYGEQVLPKLRAL